MLHIGHDILEFIAILELTTFWRVRCNEGTESQEIGRTSQRTEGESLGNSHGSGKQTIGACTLVCTPSELREE